MRKTVEGRLGNYQFAGLTTGPTYRVVFSLPEVVACWAKPTQAGADKISKALAPLKGAFQGIISVVQKIALNFDNIAKGTFQ